MLKRIWSGLLGHCEGAVRTLERALAARPDVVKGYAAFISYSHSDEKPARWLHSQLEAHTRPPCSTDTGRARLFGRPLGKVFRDRWEFAAGGDLKAEIEAALRRSEALVVLCSPRAAQSPYVQAEIEYFRAKVGGPIVPLIVEGEPPECFPPALRDVELLGADLREGGDERRLAFLKVVAGILGVGLDDLVRREDAAQRRRRVIGASVLAVFAASVIVSLSLFGDAQRGREASIELRQRRSAEAVLEREAETREAAARDGRARATILSDIQDGEYYRAALNAIVYGNLSPERARFVRGSLDDIRWRLGPREACREGCVPGRNAVGFINASELDIVLDGSRANVVTANGRTVCRAPGEFEEVGEGTTMLPYAVPVSDDVWILGRPVNNSAILFAARGCRTLQTYPDQHGDDVFTDPAGRVFLIGTDLRDARTGALISRGVCGTVNAMAIGASSRTMAIACGDGLSLVDIDGTRRGSAPDERLDRVVASDNGDHYLGLSRGTLRLFDRTARARRIREIGFPDADVLSVSEDGRRAVVSVRGAVIVIPMDRQLRPLREGDAAMDVAGGDFDAESQLFVLDSGDGAAAIWDVATWRVSRRKTDFGAAVRSHFNGAGVLSIGPHWSMVWDPTTGETLRRLPTSTLDGPREENLPPSAPPFGSMRLTLADGLAGRVVLASEVDDRRTMTLVFADGHVAEYDVGALNLSYDALRAWSCATLFAVDAPPVEVSPALSDYVVSLGGARPSVETACMDFTPQDARDR